MKKIVVFASGSGSNFQNIVEKSKENNYEVSLLFCDRKNAKVIDRAKNLSIPFKYLSIIKEKENFNKKMLAMLDEQKPDLIVLAGYMKLLGKTIVDKWENKIINIHPSLLPKFPGAHAIEQAFDNKEKEFGITIHFVDENMDTGKIIFQKSFIPTNYNLDSITEEIHKIEHKYYPKIISQILNK